MRSEAREAAFKIVFSDLFAEKSEAAFRRSVYRQAELSEEDCSFAESLVLCVEEHFAELNAKLEATVKNYSIERVAAADKAAMLVALAEIFYFEDIPPVVSVSEATAIARKYSTERSADFVNGVLGGVINA